MKYLLRSLITAGSLFFSVPAMCNVFDAPILGNISVVDVNGDLTFERVSSTTSLRVHWRNVIFLNQKFAYRSVLEVDLSSISVGAIIDSALLKITPTRVGTSAGSPSFAFLGYVGDGTVGLSDADAGDRVVQNVTLSSASTDVFQVDFTRYIQDLLDNGDSILGINIRSNDEGKTFNTFDEEFRSHGIQTGRPLLPGPALTISFRPVPLPGSIWFMALGFITLTQVHLANAKYSLKNCR
jgi:hypothetical protein